jgi:ribonuclease E
MLDNEPGVTGTPGGPDHAVAGDPPTAGNETEPTRRPRRRATKATKAAPQAAAAPAEDSPATEPGAVIEAEAAAEAVRPTRRRKRTPAAAEAGESDGVGESAQSAPNADETPTRTTRRRRATSASTSAASVPTEPPAEPLAEPWAEPSAKAETTAVADEPPAERAPTTSRRTRPSTPAVLFMAPDPTAVDEALAPAPTRARTRRPVEEPEAEAEGTRSRRRRGRRPTEAAEPAEVEAVEEPAAEEADETDEDSAEIRRRRRGRRGRGRGRGGYDDETDEPIAAADEEPAAEPDDEDEETAEAGDTVTRRRRRRRRSGSGAAEPSPDDPANTVVRVRERRDEVQGVSGSTRLEAKRQRRRDGREQRRTRPPILSESEFLARREAVDRDMVVRQKGERTQIAVLEDGVLVEHYVTRASSATMIGNVYLGRVQNVLPSMEAAFVDIGRGRNAVLYAGEVNWDATGLEGRTRTIEQALRSGDSVLVQVTKDPVGTKGARLTSHIALSGRHLVYVPHGNASGISRKLSDVERKRLRDVLKHLVPDGAGVIVRTAAEGASEDELARDVKRLQAQWDDIQERAGEVNAPALLYQEPDLVIRVVRDLFNEDFRELVVQGTDAYDMVEPYLQHVSPDLVARLRRYTGTGDVFHELRVDEQILKGLDRRVYLPSGGSLVIDRTEAMTVIDVNTGKYTGTGGNLEETVTRNNLEAAEEIVRQLRLRDLGGIVVIDFIDMVLESNRELVLRRLTECLGRDRTKHQVTEITSLGLVQMTRKRVGQGLLEAFSEPCEVCKGRGLIIHSEPVAEKRGGGDRSGPAKVAAASAPSGNGVKADDEGGSRSGRRRGRRGGGAAAPVEIEAEVEADVDVAEPTDDDIDPRELAEAGHDPAPAVEGLDDAELDTDEEFTGRRRTRRGTRRRTRA